MSRVHQLFLMTADLDEARTFYEDGLGLSPDEVGTTSVSYTTGGCQLKLQADFEPDVLSQFGLQAPPGSGRGAGAVYVLAVDAPLEAVYRRLERQLETTAGELIIEPREVPWGGRMFLVRDPDGYVWEVRANEASADGVDRDDTSGA